MEAENWFYVQSHSDAGKLVVSHLSTRTGPFIIDGAKCTWNEWKKNSKQDKLLQEEAEEEADKKCRDSRTEDDIISSIYREKLVGAVKFFWLRKRSFFPFNYHKETRISDSGIRLPSILVNHTAGEFHLTQKAMLVRSLADHYGERGYFDFHPHTFIFTLRKRKTKNGSSFRKEQLMNKLVPNIDDLLVTNGNNTIPRIWILKPSTGSCGRGISILELYPENCQDKKVLEEEIDRRLTDVVNSHKNETSPEIIVQAYITNPLLYKGYKFDFRVYLMIASVKKPYIALYTKKGYLRVCSDTYDSNFKNRNAHITNFHVQRDHPLYDPETDSIQGRTTRVEYNDFIKYLISVNFTDNFTKEEIESVKEDFNGVDNDEFERKKVAALLDKRVHSCIERAVKGTASKVSAHTNAAEGQFALLGIDLLLDTNGNVWLIEFTKSPAFRMKPQYLNDMHSDILRECVDIALGIECYRQQHPESDTVNPHDIPEITDSKSWKLLENIDE